MNNRDIPVLLNVKYAKAQLERIQKRIQWEDDKRHNITQRYDVVGGGSRTPKGLDELVAEMDQLREEEIEQMKKYVDVIRAADEIVHRIENDEVRRFVELYYVDQAKPTVVPVMLGISPRQMRRIRDAVERAERIVEFAEKTDEG